MEDFINQLKAQGGKVITGTSMEDLVENLKAEILADQRADEQMAYLDQLDSKQATDLAAAALTGASDAHHDGNHGCAMFRLRAGQAWVKIAEILERREALAREVGAPEPDAPQTESDDASSGKEPDPVS